MLAIVVAIAWLFVPLLVVLPLTAFCEWRDRRDDDRLVGVLTLEHVWGLEPRVPEHERARLDDEREGTG